MGLILPQSIKQAWMPENRLYYEQKGYIFTKYHDKFDVNILDLPNENTKKVKCICDYCGEEFDVKYCRVSPNKDTDIKSQMKAACSKCIPKKIKDTNLERYGVEHTTQLPQVQQKMKETMLERHGVEYALQSEEIQQKMEETCLEKYGVRSSNQCEEVKQKMKETMLERYDVEYAAQNPDIYKKMQETLIKNYGVDNPGKSEELREKMVIAWAETVYKNNTGPKSKQQVYICNLLQGELNYPISNCLLDIAFPEEKIYIEYNGSGHNLNVKLGNNTQDELDLKDFNRFMFLKRLGWKMIRIESIKDKMIIEEELVELINKCKNYLLNSKHTWLAINIDNSTITGNDYREKLYINKLLSKYQFYKFIKDNNLNI